MLGETAYMAKFSEFMATGSEVACSIPGAIRFSEKQSVSNGVHSASWG
jgi:hypothetical protein